MIAYVRKLIYFYDMTTKQAISDEIEVITEGEPFVSTSFLKFGTRAAVDQTLSRLVKAGKIRRVCPGVFVRPKMSRFAGEVTPSPYKIARAIARATGEKIQIHRAEAARRLKLSLQMPTQPVFETTGYSRTVQVGKLSITFKHVSPRNLMLAGSPAGEALAALKFIGKKEANLETIQAIHKRIPKTEFMALKRSTNTMPSWLADLFFAYENEYTGV